MADKRRDKQDDEEDVENVELFGEGENEEVDGVN